MAFGGFSKCDELEKKKRKTKPKQNPNQVTWFPQKATNCAGWFFGRGVARTERGNTAPPVGKKREIKNEEKRCSVLACTACRTRKNIHHYGR